MTYKVLTGLSIQFVHNAGESRCYPKIRVNCGATATGKGPKDKAITFNRSNYEEKYREACQVLRDWLGLKRVPGKWYSARPNLDEVLTQLNIAESVKYVYDYKTI